MNDTLNCKVLARELGLKFPVVFGAYQSGTLKPDVTDERGAPLWYRASIPAIAKLLEVESGKPALASAAAPTAATLQLRETVSAAVRAAFQKPSAPAAAVTPPDPWLAMTHDERGAFGFSRPAFEAYTRAVARGQIRGSAAVTPGTPEAPKSWESLDAAERSEFMGSKQTYEAYIKGVSSGRARISKPLTNQN